MIQPIKVLFQLLHGQGKSPLKMGVADAGHDVYSAEPIMLNPGDRKAIGTGIALAIPDGWYGQIIDRSGKALNGLKVSGGVLDSSYRGEVKVIMQNVNIEGGPIYIAVGDKIAQIVFLPVPEVIFEEAKELPDTARGNNGFGSTGK